MEILLLLTIWLLALAVITVKFHRDGNYTHQRIFSIFLIIWAILGIIYYDVLMLTTGQFDAGNATPWYSYLPVVCYSVCAGIGTYFLMMTFGKFRQSPKSTSAPKKKNNKKSGKKK